MRNEVLGLLTALLVVIGVAAGYYVGLSANVKSTSPAACSTPVTPLSNPNVTVYQMNPGSRGAICVAFFFGSTGNASFVESLGCPYPRWNNTGCLPQYYQIIPSPVASQHLTGQTVGVVFTITAQNRNESSSTTHVFGDWIGFCANVGPLVIGPVPKSVGSPYLASCIPPDWVGLSGLLAETVTGVSNLTVAVVPIQQ